MISLIKLLREVLVDEGGNVFGITSSIKKEYIKPTLDLFTKELKRIYPKVNFKFESLGSVGKKDESGDIDLGMSIDNFIGPQNKPLLSNWNIDPKEFQATYDIIRKKAKTATELQSTLRAILQLIAVDIESKSQLITTDSKSAGSGSIFCTFPQYDESGNQVEDRTVQIDINVGNIDWLKFSYYSNTYKDNVKGLHRTQLMVALFQAAGMTFSHGSGVKSKDTGEMMATNPQEAIEALNKAYNINLTSDILNDYFELISYLEKNISRDKYNQVLDIYLKILDSTRADIPTDLQDYWIKNQDRLGLKGKFLPDNSSLTKYKVA
jgi:hypothetical protein